MLGIGFDSGGSHTSFALDRGDGPVATEGNECADSISTARGDRSARAAVSWINRVIAAQPDDEICVWIGAAGFSGASAAAFRELFESTLEQLNQSSKQIEVYIANDGVSILKSPPLFGRGVAAVVGTGSVVLGAHPDCPNGVVKRGGSEWLVSDEGSGVWMTLECIRLLIKDIQEQGASDYHSPLLDRLCEYFNVDHEFVDEVSIEFRALARAERLAHVVAEGRPDAKRRIAGFVYPNIFDLAAIQAGRAHDRLAARVVAASVELIVRSVEEVSQELAAYTADAPNGRERMALVVGGNIANNESYKQLLVSAVSKCDYIESVRTIGDASESYAALAYHYLAASGREQRVISRSFDPLHPVLRLL